MNNFHALSNGNGHIEQKSSVKNVAAERACQNYWGGGKFPSVYSYFEKGCRKKCTRQSRKALWVVLSSLFFKEIWKNWHERPWKSVFECNKSRFDSYSRQETLYWSYPMHSTFRDCRVPIFSDNLSRNSCIILGDPGAVSREGRKGAAEVFKHAWKLLPRLFSRPNWLPLGLRGCPYISPSEYKPLQK